MIQYPDNPDNTVKLGIYYVLLGGLEEYNREEYNKNIIENIIGTAWVQVAYGPLF